MSYRQHPTQRMPEIFKAEVWYTNLFTVVAVPWETLAELKDSRRDWERCAEYVMHYPVSGVPVFHELGSSTLHLFVGKTGESLLKALDERGVQIVKTNRPCHRWGDEYWMKTNGIVKN